MRPSSNPKLAPSHSYSEQLYRQQAEQLERQGQQIFRPFMYEVPGIGMMGQGLGMDLSHLQQLFEQQDLDEEDGEDPRPTRQSLE
jgi:hypothetical protein